MPRPGQELEHRINHASRKIHEYRRRFSHWESKLNECRANTNHLGNMKAHSPQGTSPPGPISISSFWLALTHPNHELAR